jgi:hypothetical protein
VVAVGDSAEIELIFSVGHRKGGKIAKSASVTTNDNSQGNFRLSLSTEVYVEADSTHPVLLTPHEINFNEDNRDDKIKIKVRNQTPENLRMQLVSYPRGVLEVDVSDKEIKPDHDRDIKVKIDHDFKGDDFKKSFTIELNDAAKTRYTIPVTLARAVMTPASEVQGRAQRGVNDKGERTGK